MTGEVPEDGDEVVDSTMLLQDELRAVMDLADLLMTAPMAIGIETTRILILQNEYENLIGELILRMIANGRFKPGNPYGIG